MKVLVIKSSPHKNSSSGMVADEYIRGLKENGHCVEVFDAGHSKISPCLACYACMKTGQCVIKDDMCKLRELIFDSDMLVLVTPLYSFTFSAQLKVVLDRFFAFGNKVIEKKLKSFLICVGGDKEYSSFKPIVDTYNVLADYLKFENKGNLMCLGCLDTKSTQESEYIKKAYELGKKI